MTIRESRRLVLILIVVLAVIDLVAIGILLSPMAKSPAVRHADLLDYQQQLRDREQEVGPSRGMERKIAAATGNIAAFYRQRLPAAYSQIDAALGKAAQGSGVQLQNVTFKNPDRTSGDPKKKVARDIQPIEIDITISGPYVSDVKFINALERDHVFFVIDSVSLAGAENGVQLNVKAETYFKTGAA